MVFKIQPKPAQSDNHDRFDVLADGLSRYTIDVSLPVGYESNGRKYPVILVTDGNCFFDLTQAIVNGAAARMVLGSRPRLSWASVTQPMRVGRASARAAILISTASGTWPIPSDSVCSGRSSP